MLHCVPSISSGFVALLSPLPLQFPPPGFLSSENCTVQEAPDCAHEGRGTSMSDWLHQLRRCCAYVRKDLTAVLKTRLWAMSASDRKGVRDTRDGSPGAAGRRNRVDELRLAFTVEKAVAKEYA